MQMLIKRLLEPNALWISIVLSGFVLCQSLIQDPLTISIDISYRDKFLHFAAYFCLGLSWFYYESNTTNQRKAKYFVAILLLLFGTIIELLQMGLTTNRQGDFMDLLANSIGVFFAFLFIKPLMKLFKL